MPATLLPNERANATSELAAGLTDAALEVLREAGVGGDSVAMELELWRSLTAGLERETRRQGRDAWAESPAAEELIAQVVHRAVVEVAAEFFPYADPARLDARIRPWLGRLTVPVDIRRQARTLLATRRAEQSQFVGRSGIVRRFRLTALN